MLNTINCSNSTFCLHFQYFCLHIFVSVLFRFRWFVFWRRVQD